jgi:hypothetical protein
MTKKNSQPATVDEVENIVTTAMQSVVEGIDNVLKNMATKNNIKNMATKDDIKMLDGKIEDVKLEIRFMKDDVKGLTEELAMTPSRHDFKELKEQVRKIYLSN